MCDIRHNRCYQAIVRSALVWAIQCAAAATHGAIIDQDATIDGLNSFPAEHINIVDGPTRPTIVNMASGGSVQGFSVFGGSSLVMTGGSASSLSGIQDTSVFIMKGGVVDCSLCAVIDYDAVFHADGASTMHLFGGSLLGPVALGGSSMAHFYGTGLQMTPLPERGIIEIDGIFASGQAFLTVFNHIPDYSTRIILHEVPEPAPTILVTATIVAGLLVNGFKRR